MSETDDGGPAFPMPYSTDEHDHPCNATVATHGMSLRDWFAGQALAGIAAKFGPDQIAMLAAGHSGATQACAAYRLADMMLANRAKDQP